MKCLLKVNSAYPPRSKTKSNRIAAYLFDLSRRRTLLLLGFCFSRLFCFRSVVVIDVFSGIACRFNNVCALKHWIFERIVSVFLCYFGSICSTVCLICKVLLFVCPGQMSILGMNILVLRWYSFYL